MRSRREVDATLVFDGDCAFCSLCVEWMDRWVPVRLPVVPWQLTDIAALGVTQAEAEHAVQLVEPGGRRTAGARAVARLLVHAGGPWAALGVLLQIPPVSWIAAAAYRLIADNRDRMPGGTAACALPQADREALRHEEGPAA